MKLGLTSGTTSLLFAFALTLGIAATVTVQAHSQSFSVIHNFTGGNDGGNPQNGFTVDTKGTLYGTASSGGTDNNGIVFKVNAKGNETVLYNFTGGTDGGYPTGSLLRDKTGRLYGTALNGGLGVGVVFEVDGKKETVLYSFRGGQDGSEPDAGLVEDASGNLYGTTVAGGATGNGTVFRLTRPKKKGGQWNEEILYSFGTGTDGAMPIAGVSLDADGNVYGTTSAGGAYGLGTIFQLTPGPGWTETILHNFQNASDGAVPYGGLISDQSGNFYGAATEGGTNGGGTVFELTPSNGSWTFNVLYSIPGWGISGSYRNVVLDASGNLYATTHCDGDNGYGSVYELTPSGGGWNYTELYAFTGGTDGLYVFSNLALVQGKLYGTTRYGGADNYGVVFEVTP
jgi:uncharacterized repeat protein (TIGR03803 family)